jgi:2-methylcitrate dehydratase PrpD
MLCHWVYSTSYGDLPAEVRQERVTLLYDQVGCMLASATLPSCQPVVELVRRLSPPGPCSIVGYPVRTSVTQAALANGTIGHGDEVDSTGQHGTGHYAATTVPTALSVGPYEDAP